MNFSLAAVTNTEFGVCRGSLRDGNAVLVPVAADVQALLRDMVQDTVTAMALDTPNVQLAQYEPSEEHSGASKLALPLESPLATVVRDFAAVENRHVDAGAMATPRDISTYFCILHDRNGNKLVAIRRSAQFKAVLGARLIQFIDDSFRAVPDRVFKLDHDFDLLIDDETVFINRVSAFELLAEVEEAIQAAAIENARELEQTLPFVEFDGISAYVADHKRAARIVAALRSRQDLGDTTVPTSDESAGAVA